MEDLRGFVNDHPTACKVAGGLFAAAAGITLHRWLRRRKAREVRKNYPPNTVILHQPSRGPYAPSLVPFAVKLETYLRMARIPYQNELSRKASSKGKFPWMTFNGEDIPDSAFCIQYLNKRYDVDFSAWMSPEQRAVAVAFQRLVEDDLYWVMVVTRWMNELDMKFVRKLQGATGIVSSLMVKYLLLPAVRKMTWAQGMGRHSPEEVRQIARKDLTALSDYLGDKKFLMGDRPCEEDCAVFGQLSQVYWQMPNSSVNKLFKEEFPRLVSYCERMKDTFWPDWVDCTTRGGTVEATR